MKIKWLAAMSAVALIGAPISAMTQQPKDKPAAESKASETPKPDEKKAGQPGQAAAPSSSEKTAGSSDNSGSGTTGSSTGGFSSSGRLNDPSPSRTMQPGGQY